MATPTYDLLDSTTLASSASSVTFSSISQDYRDLVLVINVKGASGSSTIGVAARFNGDTSGNYSYVTMQGDGSSANSYSSTGETYASFVTGILPDETNAGLFIAQIMDYSATDKHKTMLSRGNQASDEVGASANRWASTSAISSVTTLCTNPADNFATGSTFYLYGIAS